MPAGDADTEDEGETVGQADGEPQVPEEAAAAHQFAVVWTLAKRPPRSSRLLIDSVSWSSSRT